MDKLLHTTAVLACAVLASCAAPSDTAVFVTKTSLGFDVESTPPGASVGYDRVEGYVGPRYDTGSLPSVAGIFSTDGGLLNRKVRQTYATGTAAHIVTAPEGESPSFSAEHFSGERKTMFFGAGTVLGVKLAFGTGGLSDFTFGYKRKELSSIPVAGAVSGAATPPATRAGTVTPVFAPVFAHFDNLTNPAALESSDVQVRQFFATGRAAEQMALQLRAPFKDEARSLVLSQYREAERLQTNSTLRILHCVARLPDTQLSEVWENAEFLKIFRDPAVPGQLRSASAHDARALYTGRMRIIDAQSRERTAALAKHENFVCK